MVAPSSSANAAGNRFRQRKISTKQTLQIFKQSQISDIDNEDLQQRDTQEVETGVDKNEEDEVHLQKILKKTGISNTSDAYIPTPDASKVWPEAEKYYKGKFVEPESYIKSSCQVEDYIGCSYNMDEEDDEFLSKLSKELTSKKQPLLTEDEFELIFESYERAIAEKQPFLSTDPSQILPLDSIKSAVLKVDKSSIENINKTLGEELKVHPFVTSFDAKSKAKTRTLSVLIELYGDETYEFFKTRKIARLGKTITPILKFTGEDDSDAYICFRQRQFRQQRKTRRADTQSSEKLIKLYQELKSTKELAFLVAQRELKRLEAIHVEKEIFELRCKVKTMKRELGITDSDEDLVAHKKKKVVPPPPEVKAEETPTAKKEKKGLSKVGNNANIPDSKTKNQSTTEDAAGSNPQQFQPYVKLPPSKIPDMDLETVQYLLKNKDISMQKYVEEKLKKRKLNDFGYINLTDDTNNPYFDISLQDQKILDPNHTPYSSITSSFFDIQSFGYIPGIDKYATKGTVSKDNDAFVYSPTSKTVTKKVVPEKFNPMSQNPVHTSDPFLTLRKRVGRLGQVYIDRKSMIKSFDDETRSDDDNELNIEELEARERHHDQWKFDSEVRLFETSNDSFSDDPSKLNSISNETQVIRFGGMLLSKAYETLKESILHQRQQLYYQQIQRMQKQQKEQQLQAQTQPQNGQSSTDGQGRIPSASPNPQKLPSANKQTPQTSGDIGIQSQQARQSQQSLIPTNNVINKLGTPIKSEN